MDRAMSKLLNELEDLILHDNTIYSFVKMNQNTSEEFRLSDIDLAILIIRKLSHEKEYYFEQTIDCMRKHGQRGHGLLGERR